MDSYEALLQAAERKAETKSAKKDLLNKTFWNNINEYKRIKENNDFYETNTTYSIINVANAVASGEYFDLENFIIENEIEQLKKTVEQLEMKNEIYSDQFYKFAEELSKKYNRMTIDLETSNVSRDITKFKEQSEIYKEKILRLSKELEENKKCVIETDLVHLDNFNLNKVNSVIKSESLKHYGDPYKMQKLLNEMKNNIEVHKTKIKNIKEKFDVI